MQNLESPKWTGRTRRECPTSNQGQSQDAPREEQLAQITSKSRLTLLRRLKKQRAQCGTRLRSCDWCKATPHWECHSRNGHTHGAWPTKWVLYCLPKRAPLLSPLRAALTPRASVVYRCGLFGRAVAGVRNLGLSGLEDVRLSELLLASSQEVPPERTSAQMAQPCHLHDLSHFHAGCGQLLGANAPKE